MRREPLLTAVPPAPVRSLIELYAIAFDQAQKAARQYGALAEQTSEFLLPLRSVFEVLATRERNRCDSLSLARWHHEAAAAPATNVYAPLDAGSSPLIPSGMFRLGVSV